MTDEAYDAQTLATSARIERLHEMRFGPARSTWTCGICLHVNRESPSIYCDKTITEWDRRQHFPAPHYFWPAYGYSDAVVARPFPLDGFTERDELIFSRAN